MVELLIGLGQARRLPYAPMSHIPRAWRSRLTPDSLPRTSGWSGSRAPTTSPA